MNSKQIECFLCVADCLNISNSAKKLYASQSAVSRQISLLEEELGFPLFVRGNNYLRLTPSGAAMYQTFLDMSRMFDQKKQSAALLNAGKKGTLKIGFYCNMQVETFFTNIMQQFHRKYPDIVLDYGCAPSGSLDTFIRSNYFDVIFLHDFDRIDNSEFLYERVCPSRQFLIYGACHPLARKEQLQFSDFKNETFWCVKGRNGKAHIENQKKIFDYYGIEHWERKEAPNIDTALLNVRLGNGCIFIDPLTHHFSDQFYHQLELAECVSTVEIMLAWNKSNLNPAIPLFVNQFIDTGQDSDLYRPDPVPA